MMPHPGMRCRNEGNLLSIESMSDRRSNPRNILQCKVCKSLTMKYAYACNECSYCFCLKCGRSIADYIQIASGKLCQNGHSIKWMCNSPDGEEIYECSICNKYYDYGFFYCEKDEFKYCLEDIKSLN